MRGYYHIAVFADLEKGKRTLFNGSVVGVGEEKKRLRSWANDVSRREMKSSGGMAEAMGLVKFRFAGSV